MGTHDCQMQSTSCGGGDGILLPRTGREQTGTVTKQYMPFIIFDTRKIIELKSLYKQVMQQIKSDLSFNPDSHKETTKALDLSTKTVKIKDIEMLLNAIPDNETYQALFYYLKMKYAVRNYLDCILKHEVNGLVRLRIENNRLLMPNKRPLPYSEEIWDCVKSTSSGIVKTIIQRGA